MKTSFLENVTDTDGVENALRQLTEDTNGNVVFSTSFGIEDQVITHAIFSQNLKGIEIFTLDTGRLFPETYALWDKTSRRYNILIKSFYPNANETQEFVDKNGINGFYNAPELRKECCFIRKVAPLQKALQGASIWITGLRAEQSNNRSDLEIFQWDEQYQLYKYNPLLHWTSQDVKDYIQKNSIPYNPLHDQGFVSIGCAPCTRAIAPGEDFRSGRWWWEDNSKKECGLHK